MGGYWQKKRCRLSLIHLLWCWPSRPFMFKSRRAAVKDLGRVLEWVGSASLLRMFVMATPIAPTVEMKRTATEAAVVVVKIVAPMTGPLMRSSPPPEPPLEPPKPPVRIRKLTTRWNTENWLGSPVLAWPAAGTDGLRLSSPTKLREASLNLRSTPSTKECKCG